MTRGATVTEKELLDLIDVVLFQCKLLLSITKVVTRASFDLLKSQQITNDLATFIRQYLERVYVPLNKRELRDEGVEVTVEAATDIEFKRSFDPYKFIVVLDNLIDNSRKAKARHVIVRINILERNVLELRVADDGVGIPDKDLGKLFKFGSSATGGSGIGLYHVRKVLEEYGSIDVNNKLEKGVEFIIRVKK
jgi:signal transduction histidine kinase